MSLSACGGDDSGGAADTTTASSAAETTAATTVVSTTAAPPSTTTTVADGPIDVSTLDVPPSPVTGPFAEGDLQLEGDIVAAWYVTGDVWTVYYDGLEEEEASGKCLGTALVKAGGVVHETSSPYGALACQGFVTEGEILPPGSVHRCGEEALIFFTSTIPITEDGVLAAAIDKVDDTGGSEFLTSEAAADPTDVPELDFSGCQVIS
jgi:hypothetical protein